MLVSTVAILTPRVVRAVAAQLVQNIDSPPRNAWSGSCQTPSTDGTVTYCSIPLLPNSETTIQTATFAGQSSTVNDHVVIELNAITGGNQSVWFNQLTKIPGIEEYLGINYYTSSIPLTLYADYSGIPTPTPAGGTTVGCTQCVEAIVFSKSQNTGVEGAPRSLYGTFTLIGYTVSVGAPGAN